MIRLQNISKSELSGFIRFEVTISISTENEVIVWFEFESVDAHLDEGRLSFLLVFLGMIYDQDVQFDGTSISLIQRINLRKFVTFWSHYSTRFHDISLNFSHSSLITTPIIESRKGIMCYSGGVDAAYSLTSNILGRGDVDVDKIVLVHGFDISLSNFSAFNTAKQQILSTISDSDLDVKLEVVRTNWKDIINPWRFSFPIALSVILRAFQDTYSVGVIASGAEDIFRKELDGSNPYTDLLLGDPEFYIYHHGEYKNRLEKLEYLEGIGFNFQHLRFCFSSFKAKNCGQCEKCLRTALCLRLRGYPSERIFESDIFIDQYKTMYIKDRLRLEIYKQILDSVTDKKIRQKKIFKVMSSRVSKGVGKLPFLELTAVKVIRNFLPWMREKI